MRLVRLESPLGSPKEGRHHSGGIPSQEILSSGEKILLGFFEKVGGLDGSFGRILISARIRGGPSRAGRRIEARGS
jgi:hypothetical protein